MDDTAEVFVESRRPIASRVDLEAAVRAGKRWVVVTDRPGHHPGVEPSSGVVVVSTVPVTEAMKIVVGGRVAASIDRSSLVEAVVPVATTAETLMTALAQGSATRVDVVGEVMAAGGKVVAAV